MHQLSSQWVDALDAGLRSRHHAGPALEVVVEVVVDDDDAPLVFHLCADDTSDARPRAVMGRAPAADVRLVARRETAEAVARGERSAQEAFMAGDLRVGGDPMALVRARPALAALAEVFAAVRSEEIS